MEEQRTNPSLKTSLVEMGFSDEICTQVLATYKDAHNLSEAVELAFALSEMAVEAEEEKSADLGYL